MISWPDHQVTLQVVNIIIPLLFLKFSCLESARIWRSSSSHCSSQMKMGEEGEMAQWPDEKCSWEQSMFSKDKALDSHMGQEWASAPRLAIFKPLQQLYPQFHASGPLITFRGRWQQKWQSAHFKSCWGETWALLHSLQWHTLGSLERQRGVCLPACCPGATGHNNLWR